MTHTAADRLQTVEDLRRDFDHSFAVPVDPHVRDSLEFLAIRVAGLPFALRAAEVTRIETDRPVVDVPGADPELLGIAGIQGKLVPVYSLALLLSLESSVDKCPWIVLCGRDEPFGLAFQALDAYLHVSQADLLDVDAAEAPRRHVAQAVRSADAVRPVIRVSSIQSVIAMRGERRNGSSQET